MEESVQAALGTLKQERDRLTVAIEMLEGLLGEKKPARRGRPRGSKTKGKRGRPRGKAVKAPAGAGKKVGKAPRGFLMQKMIEVLRRAGKPVRGAELRDLVVKAGYPVKNLKNLYLSLYATAKKHRDIKKTKEGFSLKKA